SMGDCNSIHVCNSSPSSKGLLILILLFYYLFIAAIVIISKMCKNNQEKKRSDSYKSGPATVKKPVDTVEQGSQTDSAQFSISFDKK
ncbi:hypothetical protein PMAYCL1PPCAC_01599, partial [Pristionchus mayeri]